MEAAHIKFTEKFLSSFFEMLEPNEKEMPGANSSSSKSEVICVSDETIADDACSSDTWITVGNMALKMSDKEILLDSNGKLSGKHINMGQQLIKQHFPSIYRLQSTLFQQKKKFISLPANGLQVVHLPGNWIAVSTINVRKEDVIHYLQL